MAGTPSYDAYRAYREMARIRAVEEAIADRYPEGKMRCPVHLSIGQESPAVGVCMALRPDDHVYSTHRCHAHYLAKGGNLEQMLAELHGGRSGCSGGVGGSMHLVDESVGFMGTSAIVGSSVALAVGSALAFKLDGSHRIAVAFCGDAVLETGVFWEAVNAADLWRLPLLIVCEDNQYATNTHIEWRQPRASMVQRLSGFGLSAFFLADYEVGAVFQATRELLGHLPAFLHVRTYRYRGHVTPGYDWDIGYRSEDEVRRAMAKDPLKALAVHLPTEWCRSAMDLARQEAAAAMAPYYTEVAPAVP